jgi:flagellin
VLTVANQGMTLVSSASATSPALLTTTSLSSATNAATAVTALDSYISDSTNGLNKKLSDLGSASRNIDAALSFSTKLNDTLESGIGNLVDADMAKESARMSALQTKQQLGIQALSMANQGPSAIGQLFRG